MVAYIAGLCQETFGLLEGLSPGIILGEDRLGDSLLLIV